jgi:hypothetical protein
MKIDQSLQCITRVEGERHGAAVGDHTRRLRLYLRLRDIMESTRPLVIQ